MSSGLATTPSSPAPSNVENHSRASAMSAVERVTCTRALAPARGSTSRPPRAPDRRGLRSAAPGGRRPGGARAEPLPALAERAGHEVVVAEGEQVEGDQGRRRLARQQVDPAGRGVDAQLQRLEVEPVAAGDHDLAVEDAPPRR